MDHTIVHFEIPANDTEKIKKFYEGDFGWKITKAPFQGQEYWLIETVPIDEKGAPIRPGINGVMYPRSPQWKEAKPVNYFTVENIDEYLKKVEKIGGKIVIPKSQVPTVGWIAVALDPEENQIGLLQPEMP